jgi:hypothetical protein
MSRTDGLEQFNKEVEALCLKYGFNLGARIGDDAPVILIWDRNTHEDIATRPLFAPRS